MEWVFGSDLSKIKEVHSLSLSLILLSRIIYRITIIPAGVNHQNP